MKPPLIFSDGETTTDPLQGVWLYHPEKNSEYESEVIQILSDPPSEGWILFSSQEKRDNQKTTIMKYQEPLNREILKHLAEGLTIKATASKMNLSKTAIEKRLLIMRKETDSKSNAHLIVKCTSLRTSET